MPGLLSEVTPVILTRDEEANIGRTLAQLTWAREVIVLDSESTDRTRAIAESFANVRFAVRPFDDLASQWNAAVALATTNWILTLDADYFVPNALVHEIDALQPDADAYEAEFVYAIDGRPLRASLYTPRAVLLRRGAFEIFMDGHTQRVRVQGKVGRLRERIVHDDRKDLRRFIDRQRRYMRDEAAKLRAARWRDLPASGKVRKLRVVAPFAVALHALLVKRTGWRYALERVIAELILSRELFRRTG